MKARLVPVYLPPARNEEFDAQVANLKTLLAGVAELLDPVELGASLPDAEAVVFPQILGEAYRQVDAFRRIKIPILVIASEYGTVSMWDWEIAGFLRAEGVETFAPYSLDHARLLCRTLAVKRELRETKYLVFQDQPGVGGSQAPIFKRFFWWEDECIARMRDRFGVTVVKKSYRELGERARQIPEARVREAIEQHDVPAEGLSGRQLASGLGLYLALRDEAEEDPSIRGMGINCLNESDCTDTTPCLAWDLLYQEKGIVWACEGDLMSLMTQVLLNWTLRADVIMTNIYPFLLGMAALSHEKIPAFPPVEEEPENHLLLAHCGYFGIVPRCLATEWTVRPKVLAIVDENAHAIDARMPEGPVTLTKLDPTLGRIQIIEGALTGYAQYPESHCRNGAVVRVPDGHALMRRVCSHHQCLLQGHHADEMEMIAEILGITPERIE